MTLLLAAVLATSPVVARDFMMGCSGEVFAAIDADDLDRLRLVVTPETVDQPGTGACAKRTPLQYAAERGRLDAVRVLLELDADVDFTVVERQGLMKGRVTAECLARANGHEGVAKLLKSRGASDTVDGCRRRAVTTAALESENPARLAQERRAGNRLTLAQLEVALETLSCEADPALCVELARHVPKEPSDARARVLSSFVEWAQTVPELKPEVSRLQRVR
jgi:hypothetical protein